jgi:hypothetical protein
LLKQAYDYFGSIVLENKGEVLDLYGSEYSYKIADSSEKLLTFQDFLLAAGVHEKLAALEDPMGRKRLYFVTNPDKPLLFDTVASSGTKALCNFFYMYSDIIKGVKPKLLILDEFDAFYHYELSEFIVITLKRLKNVQVIFTTHNTNLMPNYRMRPDCLFILSKDGLTSLANATDRELREGHNLERLYMGGSFD